MEMVLSNGFCEMSQKEFYEVNGGFVKEVVTGVKFICKAAGAAAGLGPVGGGVLIGTCIVAVGVAIYAGMQE